MSAIADNAGNHFLDQCRKPRPARDMGAKKLSKKENISGRIDAELKRRVEYIGLKHGVSDTRMLTDALDALCDYVIARGNYVRPMKMVYDAEMAAFMGLAQVAETIGPSDNSEPAAAAALDEAQRQATLPPPEEPPNPPGSPPAEGEKHGKKPPRKRGPK
jgi:hypothetical protein